MGCSESVPAVRGSRAGREARAKPSRLTAWAHLPCRSPERRGLAEPPASESVEHPGQERSAFPSYEELSADLIEAIDQAGLFIEDVRHHLEPSVGERRFECTVGSPPASPRRATTSTSASSGTPCSPMWPPTEPASDCDLYHDDDEAEDCPHHQLTPQPFVELEAEFILGDGGYELHEVS